MSEEKNIRLTVVQPSNEADNEIVIDFSLIFAHMKRLLVLWLAFAVALGAFAGAIGMILQQTAYVGDAMALIQFSYTDAVNGLAPNGEALDISMINSPVVLTEALRSLDIDLLRLEKIRSNIKITSVMSNRAQDQQTLYYNLLTKSGNLAIVDSLLDMNKAATRYIISFDYHNADYTREEGIQIVNEVVQAYQNYFNDTYNHNEALQNTVNVIDYRDYDYAEAASIFSSQLDQITSYLNSAQSGSGATFRSSETGFSFGDLLRQASTLNEIEMDRILSYIVINSVTSNDVSTQISYYQWRIENLKQEQAIQESKLASLTEQLAIYQKDPVLYIAGEGGGEVSSATDSYDRMIQEKLDTQETISNYIRTISYYESVIEGFQESKSVNKSDKETVEGYLESLSTNVNRLIEDVEATSNEYYDKVANADMVQLLVPAMAEGTKLISRNTLLIVGVTEAILLVCYLGASVICGVKQANAKRKTANEG